MTRSRAPGFTLLELLVAIAVFSAVAVIAYSGLAQLATARGTVQAAIDRQLATGRWMAQLEADFEQAIASPTRSEYGDSVAAFSARDNEVWMSVRQLGADESGIRSEVVRVHLLASGHTLVREQLLIDPPGLPAQRHRHTLTDQLQSFDLRFLDRRLEPQLQWPPLGSASLEELPRAVELRVTVAGLGPLRRVFELPESRTDAAAR